MAKQPLSGQATEQQILNEGFDDTYKTHTAQLYGERAGVSRRLASATTGAGEALLVGATGIQAATSTLSNVVSSATSVTLKALNTNRLGIIIVNDSTQILYVKFGTTAAATDFTYKLFPSSTLEVTDGVIYTGRIDGIWASAQGNARITELTS